MSKIIVAYWSQTGNTEEMAKLIGQGISEGGKDADVLEISSVSIDELASESCFALGCPAMGDEVLEEMEMEPFIEEVEKIAAGKNIVLFGSYGWGGGEWMEKWEERMKNAGANVVGTVIAQDSPDDTAQAECNELGKKLASM